MSRWLPVDRVMSDFETQRVRDYHLESIFGTAPARHPTEEEMGADDPKRVAKRAQQRAHKREVRAKAKA